MTSTRGERAFVGWLVGWLVGFAGSGDGLLEGETPKMTISPVQLVVHTTPLYEEHPTGRDHNSDHWQVYNPPIVAN